MRQWNEAELIDRIRNAGKLTPQQGWEQVDLKVLVPNLDYDTVRQAIRAAFPQRARSHAPENPLIVAVSIDSVIVDFLLAIPGYEELIIERAVQRDLAGK